MVMLDREQRDRLLGAVDAAHATALLQRAVAVPSVTGDELAFAALVAAELRAAGADEVELAQPQPGRPVVWSRTRGTGGGPTLLLVGHLDTVRVSGWAERWAGKEREDPFGGAVVDGAVWGRGSADLKGGIAAVLCALRTVRDAGVALRGDVITAWVCDEESGEPGLGRSIGMQALVDAIEAGIVPRADFAVYVEPTRLEVLPAQIGFLIADVVLEGRTAYFARPQEGVDALRAAHRVLEELWHHGAQLARGAADPLLGRSALLVTDLSAGGLIAVPGSARLSLIRTLLPGEALEDAAQQIRAAVARGVADSEVRAQVDFPAGRDHPLGGLPFRTPSDHPAVSLLCESVRTVAPGRGTVGGATFWSELSFLEQHGIPGAYFGPGDIATAHTAQEHVEIHELVDAVKALSLFIAGHCGAGTIQGVHP
jgi:acetylornithine deacetylase